MKRNSIIYLDNAATTYPKPDTVSKAVYNCINECGNPGRSGHSLSLKAANIVYNTRCLIGEMFSCDEERVVFTKNATEALNIAIKSLAPENSHILISDIEHNSVLRPVASLANSGRGIGYDVYSASEDERSVIRSLYEKLKPNTRLVVACHRSNIAPMTLPINAIARFCIKNKLDLVIDASQSAGLYKYDMTSLGSCALCAPGHKSLYGAQGSGFVIFSDNISENRIKPIAEGGSGVQSASLFMPEHLPERCEAGTLCVPSIAGLLAGLEFVKNEGEVSLYERESVLLRYLSERIYNIKGVYPLYPKKYSARYGNVFSFFTHGKGSEEVAAGLDENGICTRAGLHCTPLAHKTFGSPNTGAVRVSFGAFNDKSDVDECISALRTIVQ